MIDKEEPGHWTVSATHTALVDALGREIDEYLSYYAELAQSQGHPNPDHSVLDERRAVIIILLCSYLEAVINLYFAFAFDAATAKKMDGESLLNKWVEVPKKQVASYALASPELLSDLKSLIECRKALVHMRPEYSVDGKHIHDGNGKALDVVSHEAMMRWVVLPYALVKNIEAQDKSRAGKTLSSISDAWKASRAWSERLEHYRKLYAEGRGEIRFVRLGGAR